MKLDSLNRQLYNNLNGEYKKFARKMKRTISAKCKGDNEINDKMGDILSILVDAQTDGRSLDDVFPEADKTIRVTCAYLPAKIIPYKGLATAVLCAAAICAGIGTLIWHLTAPRVPCNITGVNYNEATGEIRWTTENSAYDAQFEIFVDGDKRATTGSSLRSISLFLDEGQHEITVTSTGKGLYSATAEKTVSVHIDYPQTEGGIAQFLSDSSGYIMDEKYDEFLRIEPNRNNTAGNYAVYKAVFTPEVTFYGKIQPEQCTIERFCVNGLPRNLTMTMEFKADINYEFYLKPEDPETQFEPALNIGIASIFCLDENDAAAAMESGAANIRLFGASPFRNDETAQPYSAREGQFRFSSFNRAELPAVLYSAADGEALNEYTDSFCTYFRREKYEDIILGDDTSTVYAIYYDTFIMAYNTGDGVNNLTVEKTTEYVSENRMTQLEEGYTKILPAGDIADGSEVTLYFEDGDTNIYTSNDVLDIRLYTPNTRSYQELNTSGDTVTFTYTTGMELVIYNEYNNSHFKRDFCYSVKSADDLMIDANQITGTQTITLKPGMTRVIIWHATYYSDNIYLICNEPDEKIEYNGLETAFHFINAGGYLINKTDHDITVTIQNFPIIIDH